MISVSAANVEFVSKRVALQGLTPVINGVPVEEPRWHATARVGGGTLLRHALPVGVFEVIVFDEMRMQYRIEGLPDDFRLMSFGIRFDSIINLDSFLRHGYFSWDGSYYVRLTDQQNIKGYAMTQLLPASGGGSVIIGFDRHDRYQQLFTLNRTDAGFSLTVETLWDEKSVAVCESEMLLLFEHDSVEDALRAWARQVAAVMYPRLSAPPIAGWCSWYNLYAYITEENILDHLHATRDVVQREKLPMWVFQMDDGFTPEMGDWLDIKPQFPRGIKPLLDDIRAAGFTPGLWIAPFMVGNRSHLYREHPDWVVKDRLTGEPLAHMRFYAEFRWHKRSEEYYILDTTHPDAFEYLRQVFRTWRYEWGCEYFKTDFMHFGSEYGPDRALWHQSGLTRIEIWRRTTAMIREEIGDAVWLGCGCPLWASVGLVDAIRIGRDVGVEWRGDNQTAQSLLRDQSTRNFGNHILWQTDPDCILLREKFHYLTDTEVRSLALYAGMSAGLMMTSDDLSAISADRLALWKIMLSAEKSLCHFPLLGQSDAVLVQVRHPVNHDGEAAVFILNTGEQPVQRFYTLDEIGLNGPAHVHNWMTGERGELDTLTVSLRPHDGVLFFIS